MSLTTAGVAEPKWVGYQYVTWRLVPCIERQEFINVGVVVYAQMADFLDGAFHLDIDRLKSFAPHVDTDAIAAQLLELEAAIRGEACAGRPQMTKLGQRFGWVAAPRSTILQPSQLHGGVTADPAATVQSLLARLVLPQKA